MRNLIVLMAALGVSIAACNRAPDVDLKNASVEEVANKVAAAGSSDQFLNPGKWQTKVTVEDVSIPGMPPSQQAEMKRMFGQQNVVVDQCLTPEEARRPGGKFFTGKDAKDCRYDTFKMSGGKMEAVMQCQGQGSGAMTLKVSGNYTPDNSTTRSEMTVSSGGQGSMTIKALVEGRRIGECEDKGKK